MDEHHVIDNITRVRPSCIVNLDNEHLSQEMAKRFNISYGYKKNSSSNIKPEVFLLTNTVRNLSPEHTTLFDYAFYTLALPQINQRYFTYPSHYIGQYGAYDALRFLFSNGGFSHLVREHSIIISRQNHLNDVENARLKISEKFKEKKGINKNATCIFFAPGNTIGECDYSLEDFRKGYNEFILKYTYPSALSTNAPPKEYFKLIVSVDKNTDTATKIKDFIQGNRYETEVIIVDNSENEHYEAMCASEFGFVYNGQMLSSAVTLHLNVNTMQDMNDLHYMWQTWENRWLADINTNADRPLIHEFTAGEYWFGKIATKLCEMHVNTDLRWDQVRGTRPFITELLPIKKMNFSPTKHREIVFFENDPTIYDEYEDPIYIMSSKIANSMSNYKNSSYAITPDLSLIKSIPSITENNSIFNNNI